MCSLEGLTLSKKITLDPKMKGSAFARYDVCSISNFYFLKKITLTVGCLCLAGQTYESFFRYINGLVECCIGTFHSNALL